MSKTISIDDDDGEQDEDFIFTVFTPDDPSTFNPTLSQLTNTIRRNTRTLRNRLLSIYSDSRFIVSVAANTAFPVLPNSRAGDWYVPPALFRDASSVYFKSTDGHTNAWKFSLRRLNLHLLTIAGQSGGAFIVDSTRRGKRFPDSLAKTIPIWIAVLNSALFPELFPTPQLCSTPLAVSKHEIVAIDRLLPKFLVRFLELGLDLAELRERLRGRPMKAVWVSPATGGDLKIEDDNWVWLILVTASSVVRTDSSVEGEYVQGAGDDHEGWAGEVGLSPDVFWTHATEIIDAARLGDDEVHAAVKKAVEEERKDMSTSLIGAPLKPITPTTNVFIASHPEASAAVIAALADEVDVFLFDCAITPLRPPSSTVVHLPIPPSKKGNKPLRLQLPGLLSQLPSEGRIVFTCARGDDVAPAAALAYLCLFYDDEVCEWRAGSGKN